MEAAIDYLKQRRVELGQNVRAARENSGLTQGEVAQHLGCSRCRVNRVEQGQYEFSVAELELLAGAFNISLFQLIQPPTLETPSEKQKF